MTKEEFKKLKPGDKVKIVRKRVSGMNCMGEMDKWLGKVMTVKEHTVGGAVHMVEDQHEYCGGWYWSRNMIECKIPEAENTICILTRGGKTIAKRGKKAGIARCSTVDKYDEAKGTIIAVARLYGYGVVSDETGKVVLANEERRRIEKIAKSAAKKELRRIYRANPIDKLAEEVFGKPLKETAKDRVKKELAELEEKIEKLSHALAPLADKIWAGDEAYSLLNCQFDVMRIYANILRRRLAIWKD